MRLFYAALALEANTFLPLPTSYQAFVEKPLDATTEPKLII
jgi:microcystin degradation protein MlrC